MPLISPCTFSMDTEGDIWEDALSHAIDFSDGRVDLRCVFPNSVPQSTSAFLSQAITASCIFHIIYQTLISSWSSKSPMMHHPSLDTIFPVSPLCRCNPVYLRERHHPPSTSLPTFIYGPCSLCHMCALLRPGVFSTYTCTYAHCLSQLIQFAGK